MKKFSLSPLMFFSIFLKIKGHLIIGYYDFSLQLCIFSKFSEKMIREKHKDLSILFFLEFFWSPYRKILPNPMLDMDLDYRVSWVLNKFWKIQNKKSYKIDFSTDLQKTWFLRAFLSCLIFTYMVFSLQ